MYQKVFKNQGPEHEISLGKADLNNYNICKPKMGRDQVSNAVSVPYRHATYVANIPWIPTILKETSTQRYTPFYNRI